MQTPERKDVSTGLVNILKGVFRVLVEKVCKNAGLFSKLIIVEAHTLNK